MSRDAAAGAVSRPSMASMLAVRKANQDKAAAAQSRVVAIDHAQRQGGRDRRIDGVAACTIGALAGLRGQRLDGGDHSDGAADGGASVGNDRDSDGQPQPTRTTKESANRQKATGGVAMRGTGRQEGRGR